MTPGARAAAAIELLDNIAADETRPADRLITGWFRGRRFAGGGDRREIRSIVYAVLRRRAQIDWWIGREGGRCDSRGRVIAALLLAAGWDAGRLDAAFDGGQYRPEPLDDTERGLTALSGRPLDDAGQPLDVRCNVPSWIADPFRIALGEALERELAALLEEAPVDLRVNSLKASRAQVAAALAAGGIDTRETPFAPLGLRLGARVNLGETPVLRDGLAEPQDEASQIAALLLEAQPGESVVDFCAGAGGKTLALAAAMENSGRLVAADVSEARLARAQPRVARAGVNIVEFQVLDEEDGLWPGAEAGGFERVLVDAPCSGTGAWRRNPDRRWRLRPEDVVKFEALQDSILDEAARLVKPGGRLLYAVCSLLAGECEGRIVAFLDRHPEYESIPVRKIWDRTVTGKYPANDQFLRLLPGRDGTDGFFVAVLRRG